MVSCRDDKVASAASPSPCLTSSGLFALTNQYICAYLVNTPWPTNLRPTGNPAHGVAVRAVRAGHAVAVGGVAVRRGVHHGGHGAQYGSVYLGRILC